MSNGTGNRWAWQFLQLLIVPLAQMNITRVTPRIVELAEVMLARDQDWSPDADRLLSSDGSLCLCSYSDGAWIAMTHGEANMDKWTKLDLVLRRK